MRLLTLVPGTECHLRHKALARRAQVKLVTMSQLVGRNPAAAIHPRLSLQNSQSGANVSVWPHRDVHSRPSSIPTPVVGSRNGPTLRRGVRFTEPRDRFNESNHKHA